MKLSVYAAPGVLKVRPIRRPKIKFTSYRLNWALVEIANAYGVTVKDLRGGRRFEEFYYVRQVFCKFAKERFSKVTLRLMARELWQKDHTSALNALLTFQNKYDTQAKVPLRFAKLRGYDTTDADYEALYDQLSQTKLELNGKASQSN